MSFLQMKTFIKDYYGAKKCLYKNSNGPLAFSGKIFFSFIIAKNTKVEGLSKITIESIRYVYTNSFHAIARFVDELNHRV